MTAAIARALTAIAVSGHPATALIRPAWSAR
jgi:hypothetical protein